MKGKINRLRELVVWTAALVATPTDDGTDPGLAGLPQLCKAWARATPEGRRRAVQIVLDAEKRKGGVN